MLSIKPQDASHPRSPFAVNVPDSEPELRAAPRLRASAVPSITSIRISPHGVNATLVNISETGLLAECSERVAPGSSVTLIIEGEFLPRSMQGRVARASVAAVGANGRLRYHLGIAFNSRINLDQTQPTSVVTRLVAEPTAQPPLPTAVLRNRW